MVDTNALLSMAFAIISSFTNIVEVAREHVPTSAGDLEKCNIGTLYSPVDLFLMHRSGTCFWIRDGAVQAYESPGSYFRLQDTRKVRSYTGPASLNSNQVVHVATSTIQRLVRNGELLY